MQILPPTPAPVNSASGGWLSGLMHLIADWVWTVPCKGAKAARTGARSGKKMAPTEMAEFQSILEEGDRTRSDTANA